MHDQQVCNELKTMILAGHETTTNALAWTMSPTPAFSAIGQSVKMAKHCVRLAAGWGWGTKVPNINRLSVQ